MDFDQITVKDSPGLCRCCLSEGCYKDLAAEYNWMGDNEVYADMLLECFDIGISQHMDGPNGPSRLICEVCITRLRDACNFKKQVVASEKKFIDMLGRGEFQSKVMAYEADMKVEPPLDLQTEDGDDGIEYLEEIDFDDDEPLKNLASTSKSAEISPTKRGRGRPKKSEGIPEKKPKTSKDDQKKVSKNKTIVKDKIMPIKISDRPTARRRKNLVTLFNNTTIIPFKWRGKYLCFYCGDERPEYDDLKKHTKSHGHCSTKDYAIQGVKSGEVEVKLDVSEIYCELCSAPCNDIDEIISHLNTKHNLKYDRNIDMCFMPYRLIDLKCVACDEYFKFFNRLVNHVNVNHPQNRLVCDQCSQPFNKKRDLGSHIRNYHRQGGYRCDDCDLDFASQTKLRTHKQVVHLHSCNVCFKQFSTSAKKLKHIASAHISGGTLRCEFCLKIWATKQSFLQHSSKCRIRKEVADTAVMDTSTVDDEHRKIGVKNIRTNLAILFNMTTIYPFKFFMGKFRCFNCGKNFTESEDMKEHWMLEHPYCDIKHKSMKLRSREDIYIKVDVSTLACRVCFESMSDVDYLIDHLITLHDAAFDKSIDCKLQTFRLLKDHYLCPLCPNSETFVYFGNVLKHMNKEHSNNNLLCMYCGEAFRCDPNLRAHISRHHKLARYKCLACKLDFNSKTTLNTHLAKVHGRKIHICSKCPEKFTSTYLRQKHLIVAHNCGFKCTYCEKKFTRYSFMRDHISRTHLREKKVECSICNARFFDNFMLRMHMVKHTGDRNFHCDLCGKKFLWKKNLRGHMASHSRQMQLGNYIIPK